MYKDEKLTRILYSGWEGWLEKKGKEMTLEEDSEKNAFRYGNVDRGG